MFCWLLVGFDGTAKVELNDILYSDNLTIFCFNITKKKTFDR